MIRGTVDHLVVLLVRWVVRLTGCIDDVTEGTWDE
jgi:hypothetical protein